MNLDAQKSAEETHHSGIEAFSVNGIRVLLRNHRSQEVVAVRLYLRGGTSSTPVEQAGIDALWGQVARRGSKNYPKEKLNAELAHLGADLGSGAGEDFDLFHLRCLKRYFDRAWTVFADVLQQPLILEEELEIVRHQMLMALRQRFDSPDGRLGELAREIAYEGHIYEPPPSGKTSTVESLNRPQVMQRIDSVLCKENCLLVVVGAIPRQKLEQRIRDSLTALRQKKRDLPAVPALQYPASSLRVEERELPTNYIMGQFAAPALNSPDYPAMLLGMSILRDRFFEEVRTKRNLSYAPSAGLGNNAANLGYLYVTAVDPKATFQVMLREMRLLREKPLEKKDLNDKIEVFITRYYLQNETNQAQASFLAGYELLGGGWEQSLPFVERLKKLVPADIQRVTAKYLRNIQYSFLGHPRDADPTVLVDP